MAKKNTVLSSGIASEVVVEGLSETVSTKRALAEKLAELQRQKAKQDRGTKERDKKHAKLVELAATKNPQIRPDTLRQAEDGEMVGGRPAKGWVVEIECTCCGEARLVNTQDAFQVRYCEAHKDEARKVAGKERRVAAKVAKLEALDETELAAQIAALEAEVAAA